MKLCANDADCKKRLENSIVDEKCASVIDWDGNSTKPNCTGGCKEWFRSRETRERHPILRQLQCCTPDEDDQMNITLKRRNIEILCGIKLYSSDECQNKRKACEIIRAKDNVDHTGSYT